MSIVCYSEDKNLTIEYQENGEIKKWYAGIDICPNPICPCQDIILDLYDAKNKNDALLNHRIAFDVFDNKAVKQKGEKPISNNDFRFAKTVAKKLSQSDWIQLRAIFLEMKQHIIESTPIQQVDASFPEKKIERDSLMIGFHQIFPYAENLIINANDILYYLDDQYCLASTCSCTHTILTFLAIKDGQPMNKSRPMVMMFDYKDKSYKVEDPGATVYTPPEDLFNKILNSNLVTKFKERHKKLRLLYYNFRKKKRKSLKKSFKNPFMAKKKDDVQKVGRNAPCPCGSGKKFKKCCM